MVKLDLKLIFWSLAVHRYQIKPHLSSFFDATGSGMKVIIDGNIIAKKVKIWKFCAKSMLYTSKESLEHVEFRFRTKKYDNLKKNPIFDFFLIFIQRGDPLVSERKISFFWIFKIFKSFFEKWPQGVLGNDKRNKVMKYELILSVHWGVTLDHLHVRADCVPPV